MVGRSTSTSPARTGVTVAVLWVAGIASGGGPGAVADLSNAPKYVGVGVCISCHQRPELGNQALSWTGSKHARTFLLLDTGAVERIDRQARDLVWAGRGVAIAREAVRLGSETDCRSCHTTGSEVGPEFWEPTFHPEDGVQCEACHGPGSLHVASMASAEAAGPGGTWPKAFPRRPDLTFCRTCHRPKPSHHGDTPYAFDPDKAWPKIAHPRPAR